VLRFLSILCILWTVRGEAQNDSLDTLAKEKGYIHSLVQSSNKSYLAYGVASYYQKIIDSNYQEIATLPLNALWGGGGISFSTSEKYAAYFAYGEKDTLKIYSLESKKIRNIIFDDIVGISFTSDKNTLFLYNRKGFYLVDVKKGKVRKKKDVSGEISAAKLDARTNSIYALENKRIVIYSGKNLNYKADFCKTFYDASELWLSTTHLVVKNDETLHLYNLQNGKLLSSIHPDVGYITDVLVEAESIIVCGRKPALFIYDLDEVRSYRFKLNVSKKGIFGIIRNHKNKLLLGDDYHLYRLN
jgi:hypothetical protein